MNEEEIFERLMFHSKVNYSNLTETENDKQSVLTETDKQHIKEHIKILKEQNWDKMDILNYLKCMEEINPSLDEDIALARMERISAKYQGFGNETRNQRM